MKMGKIIGIAALAVVIILGIVIAIQPPHAHIEESFVIDAPPAAIFPEVSNYKNFVLWSPWNKMDPQVKQTFEGDPGTVGSKMNWDGPKTGKGSQRIVELVENKSVKSVMEFDGMAGEFQSEFILSPDEEGTLVTWTYDGPNDGIGAKAVWIFMGSMLSSQYNQGLQDLKELVEQKTKQ
jgi:uncharacterized protein YndB with AHSA1/START domain